MFPSSEHAFPPLLRKWTRFNHPIQARGTVAIFPAAGFATSGLHRSSSQSIQSETGGRIKG